MFTRRQFVAAGLAQVFVPSIVSAQTSEVKFKTLWKNYPMGDAKKKGTEHPCGKLILPGCLDDNPIAKEQCAVRMGVCLKNSMPGLSFQDLPVIMRTTGVEGRPRTCSHLLIASCEHDRNEMHFLNSTEVCKVLLHVSGQAHRSSFPLFAWVGPAEIYDRPQGKRSSFRKKIGKRNGIIYIQDYWPRPGETTPTGDHIDLWNGSLRRTKREIFDSGKTGKTDARFDEVASRVIFWEVK